MQRPLPLSARRHRRAPHNPRAHRLPHVPRLPNAPSMPRRPLSKTRELRRTPFWTLPYPFVDTTALTSALSVSS